MIGLYFYHPMKTKILLLLGCSMFLASAQGADPKFEIDLISPAKRYLWVDKSWQETADCVEAKFSMAATAQAKDITVKAYFFSADGKLLDTQNEPSSEGDHRGGTVKQPAQYEHGKKYSVYFAIPSAINNGAGKWKRAVIVVGKAGEYAAKIYPKDDLAKFNFPEKPQTTSAVK